MKNKYSEIQNTKANIDDTTDWRKLQFSHPERTIRLATSFSGIGAIEHSFHRLGLNCQIQFAGDIDENCKKSYFANYAISEEKWHNDVHNLDAKPYKGKVDLFVGGAPCQAFSLRGKHGGFEDTRGTLFREFARVVIECQPKVFIFENVKGMLSHDKGRTWNVIKETFENDCGYNVYFQVLNAKDYGIPQSRERIYCIGFKKKTKFKYPAPIKLENTVYDFLQKKFDKKYLLKRKGVNFITRTINHMKSYTQVNGSIILCQKRNQQFNWHGDFVFHPKLKEDADTPETDETLYRVADFEEDYYLQESPSKYAIKNDGNVEIMFKASDEDIDLSYGRFRKLTPRECLRLMGFDDTFKIVVSDTETYKQAGNSIVVNVLMARPLPSVDAKTYMETHFRQVLGKVYTPFAEENIFSLALDKKDDRENKELIAELEKSFVVCKCQLGTNPHEVLPAQETIPVVASKSCEKNILTCIVRKTDDIFKAFAKHEGKVYVMEKIPSINIMGIKYLLPMVGGMIDGYYDVLRIGIIVKDEKPALRLRLGEYHNIGENWVLIYKNKMQPGELISLDQTIKIYND